MIKMQKKETTKVTQFITPHLSVKKLHERKKNFSENTGEAIERSITLDFVAPYVRTDRHIRAKYIMRLHRLKIVPFIF